MLTPPASLLFFEQQLWLKLSNRPVTQGLHLGQHAWPVQGHVVASLALALEVQQDAHSQGPGASSSSGPPVPTLKGLAAQIRHFISLLQILTGKYISDGNIWHKYTCAWKQISFKICPHMARRWLVSIWPWREKLEDTTQKEKYCTSCPSFTCSNTMDMKLACTRLGPSLTQQSFTHLLCHMCTKT